MDKVSICPMGKQVLFPEYLKIYLFHILGWIHVVLNIPSLLCALDIDVEDTLPNSSQQKNIPTGLQHDGLLF